MSGSFAAIVAALPEEIGPLVARLEGSGPARRRGRAWRGSLAGREVVLALTGDGAAAAGRGAAALLAEHKPALLLGLGVAGGLSPDLERGALVAAGEVRRGEERWQADTELLRRALDSGRAVEGVLTSSERVVDSPEAKERLWRRQGCAPRLGVDLESAAWAAAATAAGIPWLVVRAISDHAHEALPLPFGRLAGPGGQVARARVAAHLALRPWRLPATLALRRRVRVLAGDLAELALEVLA